MKGAKCVNLGSMAIREEKKYMRKILHGGGDLMLRWEADWLGAGPRVETESVKREMGRWSRVKSAASRARGRPLIRRVSGHVPTLF